MPGTYISPAETGLYYLQSRYYDPEVGRFVNADGIVATGQGLLGNNMFSYCQNNPILFVDPLGQLIVLSPDATEDQIDEYERAIAYLQDSETGRKLIEILEKSAETFFVVFIDDQNPKYTTDKTIFFDPHCGLILADGASVMSPAMTLAHEMGHALQDLTGQLQGVTTEAGILLVEENNVDLIETPIAKELGEPYRDSYLDAIGTKTMQNSTHYTTVYTRPWWYYLNPKNWKTSRVEIRQHNLA